MERIVAVTGAAGMVGREVIGRLAGAPGIRRLIGIDARNRPVAEQDTEFVLADIRHPMMVDLLREYGVDTVVHLGMLADPSRDAAVSAHEWDVIGTLKFMNACSACNVKQVVMTSTTAVYGAHPANPAFLSEYSPLRADRRFSIIQDRIETEKICLRYQRQHPAATVTILRCAMPVGPRLNNYITRMLDLPFIPVFPGFDPLLQFIHEEDLVQGITTATLKNHSGIFNLVGKDPVSLRKAIKILHKIPLPILNLATRFTASLLWDLKISFIPPQTLKYFRYSWVADGSRFRDAFEYQPTYSSEQALMAYLDGRRERLQRRETVPDLLLPDIRVQRAFEDTVSPPDTEADGVCR